MTWTLIICIGVSSWGGCGAWQKSPGLDLETCVKAAEAANVDGVNSVAFCRVEEPHDREIKQ